MIDNTSEQHPLLNFLAASEPNGIERQEAQGQRQFVNSQVLPTDGLSKIAELGIDGLVIGEAVSGDPVFTNVTLPNGWTKAATDHSMWSNLLDDKGRVRAAIFYKGSFYDRSAFISPRRRYTFDYQVENNDYTNRAARVAPCAKDSNGTIIWQGDYLTVENPDRLWETSDKAAELAKEWLDANYPNHSDFTAYWE